MEPHGLEYGQGNCQVSADKNQNNPRRSTDGPALLRKPSRMILCGEIPLDAEFLGMAAGLCHIVRKPHPKKVVQSGPNAFSMRRAISGGSHALPARRSNRVARRSLRMSAALEMLTPRAPIISVLIKSPGWPGPSWPWHSLLSEEPLAITVEMRLCP